MSLIFSYDDLFEVGLTDWLGGGIRDMHVVREYPSTGSGCLTAPLS